MVAALQTTLIPEAEDAARLDEYEVWRTPLPVARQPLACLSEQLGWVHRPARVLDPSAGCGVFGVAARERWPDAELVAVEPREEEQAKLHDVYDRVHVSMFDSAPLKAGSFDLIVTNPAFSLWAQIWETSIRLLAPNGVLVLYLPSTMGHSDEPAERGDIFDFHPPLVQLRVMGRVRHRTGINPNNGKPYGADNRKHSFWVWRKQATGSSWRTYNLPRLPRADLTYRPLEHA